jgi:hypothetical protein
MYAPCVSSSCSAFSFKLHHGQRREGEPSGHRVFRAMWGCPKMAPWHFGSSFAQLQQSLDRKHCTSCTRTSARKELHGGQYPQAHLLPAPRGYTQENILKRLAAAQEEEEGWRWIGVHMAECSAPEDTATRTMSVHGAPEQHRQHCVLPRQRGRRVAGVAVRSGPGHVPC